VSVTGDAFIEVAISNAAQAAEEHLAMCFEALGGDDVYADVSAPFCGCMTCIVREVISKSWPYMRLVAIVEAEDN